MQRKLKIMKLNMKINKIKLFSKTIIVASFLYFFAFSSFVIPVHATVNMMAGDFFRVGNNTVSNGSVADAVDASPNNIVEFFIRVRNQGDETAKNVQVWAQLPSTLSTQLITTAFITPNNPGVTNVQISDTATVNVLGGQPVALNLLPGHSRLAGVTNLFNCPNACDIPDSVPNGGLNVGDIPAGGEVQLGFKAVLTGPAVSPTPTPTPTPTPGPTVTPTPTPTPKPTVTPTPTPAPQGQSQNQTQNQSQTQTVNNNVTNNNSSSSNSSANVTVSQTTTPQVLGVASAPVGVGYSYVYGTTLPKTGLPALAWLGSGLVPLGFGIKRFGKRFEAKISESANYIWEKRSIDKQA